MYRDNNDLGPRCGTPLVQAGAARGCEGCRGVWIPAENVRDMAAHYPERLVSLQKGDAIDEILEITARGSISRIDGPVVERGRSEGACWAPSLDFPSGSDVIGPATRPTASCTRRFSRPPFSGPACED